MRRQLDLLGLYGTRVSVQQNLAKKLPYVDGVFNLIFDPGQKTGSHEHGMRTGEARSYVSVGEGGL